VEIMDEYIGFFIQGYKCGGVYENLGCTQRVIGEFQYECEMLTQVTTGFGSGLNMGFDDRTCLRGDGKGHSWENIIQYRRR
jgi:hypothetical protein